MKKLVILLFAMSCKFVWAQDLVQPGGKAVQAKWIRDDQYSMKWYSVRDTMRNELGKINTTVSVKDGRIYIVTDVVMKKATGSWLDSTVADARTISPIYHSSRNARRHMAIYYDKTITGYYQDNISGKTDQVHDEISSPYFDSNIYTSLLAWLPLQAGYKATIPVYDYNSAQKHGLVNIVINGVKEEKYTMPDNSSVDVYVLDVMDGIIESPSTYYISKKDRQVLKIVASFGPAKMEMVRM